jgi:hypothetical protein
MRADYGDGNRRKPLHVPSLALETTLLAWIQRLELTKEARNCGDTSYGADVHV